GRNCSEKKFQSYDSVIVVAQGGRLVKQTGCAIDPACVVNPRPVEMSAACCPSVGSAEPSELTTRPSPTTANPGTLPANPRGASKLALRMTPWVTMASVLPLIVNEAGGVPPAGWPGTNAWPVVRPPAIPEKNSRPRAAAKSEAT